MIMFSFCPSLNLCDPNTSKAFLSSTYVNISSTQVCWRLIYSPMATCVQNNSWKGERGAEETPGSELWAKTLTPIAAGGKTGLSYF